MKVLFMSESRFYHTNAASSLGIIARKLNLEVQQEHANLQIVAVAAISSAEAGHITFLDNSKYIKQLQSTKATAAIVPADLADDTAIAEGLVLLKSTNPYYDYACLLDLFYHSKANHNSNVAASSVIAGSAMVGANCFIGENVVISDGAEIGEDSIIEAGSYIGHGVKLGRRAKIGPQVTLQYTEIGDDVVILAGARIGQDGFGFATKGGVHKKIFHIGRVIIGNNVEIGANTTIDRGSASDTVIGDLCRIDNLVQIAHNVKIGRGSIIVGQVGIAGSTEIGDYCAIGGQAGIIGHIKIESFAQIGAQAGVTRNIAKSAAVTGTPAMNVSDHYKQLVTLKKLTKTKVTKKA